jgi:uncharacterized protein
MSGLQAARTRLEWRGVLRPGRWVGARGVAWTVALFAIVVAAPILFGLTAKALHFPRQGAASMVPLGMAVALTLAAYAAAVHWGEGRRVTELAPSRFAPDFLGGLAFGAAAFVLVMGLLLLGGWYQISAPPPGAPWKGIGIGLGVGVVEELLFRGVLMRMLWEAFGLPVALVVSSSLFGLAHLLNPQHSLMGAVSIIVEAGIMLGALYALTGRLWASIGAHAGWNFTQGYVFGADVSGTDPGGHFFHVTQAPGASWLLTGGAFGPEASVPAVLVGGISGAIVLAIAWRRGAASRAGRAAAAGAAP